MDFQEGKALHQAVYDMLYLACCSVKEKTPDKQRVLQMNLSEVYRIAHFHNVTALLYFALEPLQLDLSIMKKWKEDKDKALLKNVLLDVERKNLFTFMNEQKIWYMSLKGVYIKEYYPKPGMRQMSDNDILFDDQYEEVIHDYFVKNGYEVDEYQISNHDTYHKKPVLNFEMHMALFISGFDLFGHGKTDRLMEYYKNIKDQLLRVSPDSYEYMFTPEDFYLYFLVHSYKHYVNSGTGVKVIFDTYVILKQYADIIDWDDLHKRLDYLGLVEYEKNLRTLTTYLFEHFEDFQMDSLPLELQKMLFYIVQAGTYGKESSFIENQIHKQGIESAEKAKWSYIKRRLIPDKYYYMGNKKREYIYNHKYLLPFYLIYRFFRGIFKNGKHIVQEIMVAFKFKK